MECHTETCVPHLKGTVSFMFFIFVVCLWRDGAFCFFFVSVFVFGVIANIEAHDWYCLQRRVRSGGSAVNALGWWSLLFTTFLLPPRICQLFKNLWIRILTHNTFWKAHIKFHIKIYFIQAQNYDDQTTCFSQPSLHQLLAIVNFFF